MPDPLKKTVSASQVAALFDESPYITRWMLYQHFKNGLAIDAADSELLSWGRRLQPLVLQKAREDLALEVRDNLENEYVRCPSGQLGATLDGVISAPDKGPGAIEAKCVFHGHAWMNRWSGGKKPPRDVEIQLQTQMLVGDGKAPFKWGVIAAFFGGEMHYWEREPMPRLHREIFDRAGQLLQDVANSNEPAPFGSPAEIPLITELFPRVETEVPVVIDDVELAEAARMMRWAKGEAARYEKIAEQIRPKILHALGSSGQLQMPGVTVYCKKSEMKAATVQRKAYVRTSLTVKEKGE